MYCRVTQRALGDCPFCHCTLAEPTIALPHGHTYSPSRSVSAPAPYDQPVHTQPAPSLFNLCSTSPPRSAHIRFLPFLSASLSNLLSSRRLLLFFQPLLLIFIIHHPVISSWTTLPTRPAPIHTIHIACSPLAVEPQHTQFYQAPSSIAVLVLPRAWIFSVFFSNLTLNSVFFFDIEFGLLAPRRLRAYTATAFILPRLPRRGRRAAVG